VELSLLKKYFENRCNPKEAEEIQAWIESESSVVDMEAHFKTVWDNIKVKSGDYQKWSGRLQRVHEKIEMEELYASLEIPEEGNANSRVNKDRKAISSDVGLSKSTNRNTRYIFGSFFIIAIIVISIVGNFNRPEKSETLPEVTEISKSTEPGQKLSFHLNDGSQVLLNSGSKLSYPKTFDEQERIVHLEGEAFFEISRDSLRPFRVITGLITTTALGTSFNINYFPGDEAIEIALVTGKVMVAETENSSAKEDLLLLPGEMATYQKEISSLSKSRYSFREKISWKDGIIYFKEADYPAIMSKLELWYGVDISENKQPGKAWNFTATFEDESLDNVLKSLQFGHGFKYIIKGKNVEINF
jgi:ferric-dicitrate binding protein FerR (iron transport regulator)